MQLTPTSDAAAKLYALQLKLRPVQRGSLMAFSGEFVHAAWLTWIRTYAPDIATALHDGNRRRFFTCSSLQFPHSPERKLEAERENAHVLLNPEKTYTIRITLLLGELFPFFYNTLLHFNRAEKGAEKLPFMQIGKQVFVLEEVISDPEHPSNWTGFTTFENLIEKAASLKLGKTESLRLEFATITTFNRGNAQSRIYGNHFARLPLPQYVFPYLATRWLELAPPEWAHYVQRDRIEDYIQHDGIVITDYELHTHQVKFTTNWQPGFFGTCKYSLRGPDEPTSEEAPLTVRQQLLLLAQLAFYTGVGYKTPMGMGQTRPF